MDGMRKGQTDNFCQYPANEGANTRTGVVDFVTSENPHCGVCKHVAFDIDANGYVCMRFGVEVHEKSCCNDWLHERTVCAHK